jgi:hypothetical protein
MLADFKSRKILGNARKLQRIWWSTEIAELGKQQWRSNRGSKTPVISWMDPMMKMKGSGRSWTGNRLGRSGLGCRNLVVFFPSLRQMVIETPGYPCMDSGLDWAKTVLDGVKRVGLATRFGRRGAWGYANLVGFGRVTYWLSWASSCYWKPRAHNIYIVGEMPVVYMWCWWYISSVLFGWNAKKRLFLIALLNVALDNGCLCRVQ